MSLTVIITGDSFINNYIFRSDIKFNEITINININISINISSLTYCKLWRVFKKFLTWRYFPRGLEMQIILECHGTCHKEK